MRIHFFFFQVLHLIWSNLIDVVLFGKNKPLQHQIKLFFLILHMVYSCLGYLLFYFAVMQNKNFWLQFFACVPLSFKIAFNSSSPQSTRITILTWIISYQWPYFIPETTSRKGILRLPVTLVFNTSWTSRGQKLSKELTERGKHNIFFKL